MPEVTFEAAEAFALAVSAYKANRMQSAERICRQILDARPEFIRALELLTVVQMSLNKYELALENLDRLLMQQPKHADALNNRGVVFYQLGRFPEALASYGQALALRRDYAEALFNRAATLRALKRSEEALANYDSAIAVRPDYVEALNNRGVVLHALERFEDALASYGQALALRPHYAEALNNRGRTFQALQRADDALADYDRALAVRPEYVDALNGRANLLHELKRYDEALADYDRVVARSPEHVDALNNRGVTLHALGRFEEALENYGRALALSPDHAEALNNRGLSLHRLQRTEEALADYNRALTSKPDYANAFNNRGNVFKEMKRYGEALADYDRALAIRPHFADALNNRGVVLDALGRFADALASFGQALALRPDYAEACHNRGLTLLAMNRPEEALADFGLALTIRRDYASAYNNRGRAFQALKRTADALADYDRALTIRPDYVDALNNKASFLQDLKRYEDALACYERVLTAAPDDGFAYTGAANCAAKLCHWQYWAHFADDLPAHVAGKKRMISPFALLGYSDDPALQLQCAKNFVEWQFPSITPRSPSVHRDRRARLRVAYLSADFRAHALSYLIAGLIEKHDRTRFEIMGISFGHDDGSEIRRRLMVGFESFHDVRSMSDDDVDGLLRELKIDIAIDLQGHTRAARPGILARRPAPVQATYLGFPGTTALPAVDYVIADSIVAPFEHQPFFSERIIHLPDCYMPSDDKRSIGEMVPERRQVGLPDRGFVFCCFNNNRKITPAMFDIWMRLLRRVEGSVLWLYLDTASAERNLRVEAGWRGVDPARLVFAQKIPVDDHLARHRLADLFLDTLPYNAHTTASDALWAGLPIVTCMGRAFASRVAASLLSAIGMPELIARDLEAYEKLALGLALDPGLLREVRSKLARHRHTHPLFDTALHARHMERAFETMWEIWDGGEAPRSFAVPAMTPSPA